MSIWIQFTGENTIAGAHKSTGLRTVHQDGKLVEGDLAWHRRS